MACKFKKAVHCLHRGFPIHHLPGVLWFGISLALWACTYSFSGFFPAQLRKTYVPVFENQTNRYGLEEVATQAFIQAITEDGRLRIVPESQAALRIEGTITSYTREPFEYDATGKVISYKVTIQAELGFYNIPEGKYYLEKRTYSGWATYDVDTETEEDAIRKAMKDLVDNSLRVLFLKEF